MDRTATAIVVLPIWNQVFITFDTARFNTYFGTDLGNIYDFYITEICNEWSNIKLLDDFDVWTEALKYIYGLCDDEQIEPDEELEDEATQWEPSIQRRSSVQPDERTMNRIGNRVQMGLNCNDASDDVQREKIEKNATKPVPRVPFKRASRKEIQLAI